MKHKKLNIDYMICATPRSGSTLLCDALSNTEIAGKPDEYLLKNILEWKEGQKFEKYINSIIDRGATLNGVRGIKVMVREFSELIKRVRQNPKYKGITVNNVIEYLPNMKYIFMTRRDKIRQAISFEKAFQTNRWVLSKKTHSEYKKPIFNLFGIDKFILIIKNDETVWTNYFRKNGIKPLIIVYEDFFNDYDNTILKVLKFLGIPFPRDLLIKEPNLKKQANRESDLWLERYNQRRFSDRILAYYLLGRSFLYELSGKIKAKSKTYTRFIHWVKGDKNE
jgi:LPS sulfotransferase NodH